MPSAHRPRVRTARAPVGFEWLEERAVPAGHNLATATTVGLTLDGDPIGRSDALVTPSQVDLYALHNLTAGGTLLVSVAAESLDTPSPLNGLLRLFDATGKELTADDDFDGRDPAFRYDVTADGDYYVGVSSSGNADYDPLRTAATKGGTQGPYRVTFDYTTAPDYGDTLDTAEEVETIAR